MLDSVGQPSEEPVDITVIGLVAARYACRRRPTLCLLSARFSDCYLPACLSTTYLLVYIAICLLVNRECWSQSLKSLLVFRAAPTPQTHVVSTISPIVRHHSVQQRAGELRRADWYGALVEAFLLGMARKRTKTRGWGRGERG